MRLLTVLPVAVPLLLVVALRPGLVVNGVRSPLAWAAVAGVLLASVGVRAAVRRTSAPAWAAQAAGTVTVLLLVAALVAPSFRQRTLVEVLPVSAAPVAQASPTAVVPSPSAVAPAAPTPAPTAAVPAPVRTSAAPAAAPLSAPTSAATTRTTTTTAPAAADLRGRLEGIGHSASGTVSLRTVDGVAYVVFERVDIEGTVEPSVHLVDRGARTPGGGLRLGALKAERGSFSYRLPASVDLADGWSVLVWCDPYDTPIAAADPR